MPLGTDAIQRSVSHASASPATTGASGSGDASKERDAPASESGARGRCVSPPWRAAIRGLPAGRAMVGSARAPSRQLLHTRLPHGGENCVPDPRFALPRLADSGRSGGDHGRWSVLVDQEWTVFHLPSTPGSQEPSDQKQAARSEWRMASWYVMWALKAHQQAAQ